MSFFEKATSTFYRIGENAGKNRAMRELRGLSDDVLNDVGISRVKLNQGIGAWPWREVESAGDAKVVTIPQTAANTSNHEVRRVA